MNPTLFYEIATLRERTRLRSDNPKRRRQQRALERLERQQRRADPHNHAVRIWLDDTEYEPFLDLAGRERTRIVRFYAWEITDCDGNVVESYDEYEHSESHAQQVAQKALDTLIAEYQ